MAVNISNWPYVLHLFALLLHEAGNKKIFRNLTIILSIASSLLPLHEDVTHFLASDWGLLQNNVFGVPYDDTKNVSENSQY